MNRLDAAHTLLPKTWGPTKAAATAFAPVNIALVKYWGKRNEELHLPVTDSFSVALTAGSTTTVCQASKKDTVFLNGQCVDESSSFFKRASEFCNLVRPSPSFFFHISTINDVPTAAGLASSASGFAALTLACNDFFGWNAPKEKLSCLARLGSGSACRSIFPGFVTWQRGEAIDGADSYALPWNKWWPDLQFGVFLLSTHEKPISSRKAMRTTVETSPLYAAWPSQVQKDIQEVRAAISEQDIERFGTTVERNALTMHATMLTSSPPICFWLPQTVSCLHEIWEARRHGVPIYCTIDAGPNVKVFFPQSSAESIQKLFPNLHRIQLLSPIE